MVKKPHLKIVKPSTSSTTTTRPPRKLGACGLDLWNQVMDEYQVTDRGGIEILAQTCAALDRAEEMAAQINEDGCMIMIKGQMREHPCARGELANRAFVTRNLVRLGLNIEALKPIGRPAGWSPPTKAYREEDD